MKVGDKVKIKDEYIGKSWYTDAILEVESCNGESFISANGQGYFVEYYDVVSKYKVGDRFEGSHGSMCEVLSVNITNRDCRLRWNNDKCQENVWHWDTMRDRLEPIAAAETATVVDYEAIASMKKIDELHKDLAFTAAHRDNLVKSINKMEIDLGKVRAAIGTEAFARIVEGK